MDHRLFTMDQANEMIPSIQHRFARILSLREELRQAFFVLEQAGQDASLGALSHTGGPPEVQALRDRFRQLMGVQQQELRALTEEGIQVVDLDAGRCNMLGVRDGREVSLCWQLGEPRVTYWHEVAQGCAARQPLQDGTT